MIACQNRGCRGISTVLYTDNGWIRTCPVCNAKEILPLDYKHPSEVDIAAGFAYAKAKSMEYQEAEERFFHAYNASMDEELREGYLLWAVKCCFGVEFVRETIYPNDSQKRSFQYTPIIARFPFNEITNNNNSTVSAFESHLQNHPNENLTSLLTDLKTLYSETDKVMSQQTYHYDVFIAWHDRPGNNYCQEFAREVNNNLNNQRIYSFASFSALTGHSVWLYEPYIYTAMATAKVFVIVVDDYQALGEGFLRQEILRMGIRRKQDPTIAILFNGMKGHVGQIPSGLMEGWERHYEDSECTQDRIKLVCRDVRDALTSKNSILSDEKQLISAIPKFFPTVENLSAEDNNNETAISDEIEVPPIQRNEITPLHIEDYYAGQKETRHIWPESPDGALYVCSGYMCLSNILCSLFGMIGLPYFLFGFPKLIFAFLLIVAFLDFLVYDNNSYGDHHYSPQDNSDLLILFGANFSLICLTVISMHAGIFQTIKTFWTANYLIFSVISSALSIFTFSAICTHKSRWRQLVEKEVNSKPEKLFLFGSGIARGNCYSYERKECIQYFTRAVKVGDIDAMYALAGCYANGEFVDKSEEKAIDYLIQIAEHNDQRGYKILDEYCMSNAKNEGFWQRYPKLLEWVKTSSTRGNANSQYIFGVYSQYIKQNSVQALHCYYLAMEQKHAEAKKMLFQMISKLDNASIEALLEYSTSGDNIYARILNLYLSKNQSSVQHILKANKGLFKWVTTKAEEGDPDYEYMLGLYYQFAENSIEKSVEFYAKAYKKKHTGAAKALGHLYCQIAEMYKNGAGGKRDLDQALTYYQESHQYDCDKASDGVYSIGSMYLYGTDFVSRDIDKAVKCLYITLKWKYPSLNYYDLYAAGMCYFRGDGVSEDISKAISLFTIAADHNIDEAQFLLGKCYLEGIGVEIDRKKAVSYLEKANQSSEAIYLLAKCLEYGWGTKSDIIKSMKQYTKAADSGNLDAAFRVSELYFKGLFEMNVGSKAYPKYDDVIIGEDKSHDHARIRPDFDNGLKYLSQAARGGIVDAQLQLAECYMDGRYIPRDVSTALYWYRTAAGSGSIAAQEVLDNWNDSNTSK